MIRKCTYTDLEAKSKDTILPKDLLGEEIHNWTSSLPANSDYIQTKQNRLPTELEMQANELFHLLELAKLRVVYYESKLKLIQEKLLSSFTPPKKSIIPKSEKKKEKEIERSIAEKEVVESTDKQMEDFFQNKKKLWEED